MSNDDPSVLNVTVPLAGAVHVHHTVFTDFGSNLSRGSPLWRVAPRFDPVTLPLAPEIFVALTKLSFAGLEGADVFQIA